MKRGTLIVVITLLLIAAIASLVSINTRAAAEAEHIRVDTDRSDFYVLDMYVYATANVSYSTGSINQLDHVRFDWYYPNGTIIFSEIRALEEDIPGFKYAHAISSWYTDFKGSDYRIDVTINVTKDDNTTTLNNYTNFNVFSDEEYVVVNTITVSMVNYTHANQAYDSNTYARAKADLNFSGNCSLLEDIEFSWYYPTGTLIKTALVIPNEDGIAYNQLLVDTIGDNYTVSAEYTGDGFVRGSTKFNVVPKSIVPDGNGPGDGLGSDFIYLLLILFIVCMALLTVTIVLFLLLRRKKEEPEEETKAAAAAVAIPTSAKKLEDGNTYLVDEKIPEGSFKILSEALQKGDKGLVFTRTYPQKVREKHKLALPIIWLSRDQSETSINPTNLGKIVKNTDIFLNQHQGTNTIILLDGLEYLIVENNFPLVLKFLHQMNDTVSVNNSKLLISFDLETLSESERALITKDVKVIRG